MSKSSSSINQHGERNNGHFWRWLVPGLGIKRWTFVILAGITMLGLAVAIVLLDLYRTDTNNSTVLTFLTYASLRFLPRIVRIVIFVGLGFGLVSFGLWKLNRALLRPFVHQGRRSSINSRTFAGASVGRT